MNNCRSFWRVLLIVLAISAFLPANGSAAEQEQASKAPPPPASPSKEGPPAVQMGLEPKAIEILKAACGRLATARSLRFTATTTYESPSRLGTPLAYTTRSDVTLQRPDKLKVVTPYDGPSSVFLYDGKLMTAFAPGENLVAVTEAPATIDDALKTAFDAAAIYFPFTDLIVTDPYKDIANGLTVAFYIGQSQVVGGTTTDMVAYANKDVFIQIWVGAQDKLPRLIRAVYRQDKARLRHQMELSNWQVDQAVTAEEFTPVATADAKPIPFASPVKKQVPTTIPPAAGTSSAPQ